MFLRKIKWQSIVLSGALGLIMPIMGIIFSYYPGFIWLNNDLSDLGLYSPFFNWCLILSGLFMAFFFLNLGENFSEFFGPTTRILFLLTCASLSLLGFFPKNTPHNLHYYIACAMFFLFPLALLFSAKDFRNKSESLSNFTLFIFIAFLILWTGHYLLHKFYGYEGLAIPEFSSLVLSLIWIYVLIFKYFKADGSKF